LNRYTFEKNNPYKYVDKDGRTPIIAAAAVYTIGEFIIDVVSLTSSYMSYIDDPNSGVNIAALIADVVDIASGPLSNPGPSGIMVHMTDAAWKKTMKHAKQKGVEYLATEGLYGIETGNLFGYSIYNGYFYGNQFSSGTSYRLDQTNQIIDYGNGVSYNSGTGVVCTGELCYSTAFPESYSSGSSGKGRSSDDKDRRDNDYPGDEYCSQYSDRRCG
jgi:hypothetical protein